MSMSDSSLVRFLDLTLEEALGAPLEVWPIRGSHWALSPLQSYLPLAEPLMTLASVIVRRYLLFPAGLK